MITSVANQQMKHILQLNKKSKTRYEQRVFVVEGIKMCLEAPREDIVKMYVSESFLADEDKRRRIQGYSYEVVKDNVFRAVSDTKTPQGILCLVRMPQYCLEDLLGTPAGWQDGENGQPGSQGAGSGQPGSQGTGGGQPGSQGAGDGQPGSQGAGDGQPGSQGAGDGQPGDSPDRHKRGKCAHLLILEGIQDPGNLGTMIRTGEGAGATGILMDKTTVDIFHPKTIRATMGALYRMPFFITSDLQGSIQQLKEKGVSIYAAHLSGTLSYEEPDYRGHTGFLIGNEGNGLSPEIAGLADFPIRIPMEGKVESLNAAVAAALLMYEVRRQRG